MGERSDLIKQHIDSTRDDLDRNLRELGERVKLRNVYARHPRAVTASALGGVLVVGLLVARAFRRRRAGAAGD